jgi:glycerol-3-phosphate O-acyltransferase/dihydroxyacetone phosphate acyltransferase
VLYRLMRAIAGLALRWFYARVDVDGLERIPASSPVLLAVNHPNALVDALVIGRIFPRRMVLTAKATVFANPMVSALLRAIGVVPLIRAQEAGAGGADSRRNERAFGALNAALARGHGVLIFPEGISGDHPSLAPLKTGAARLALQARDSGVHNLAVVPIGLTFERKDAPRSRVFVQVGDPIKVAEWPTSDAHAVASLTSRIDQGLRAVTLNFPTTDDALRASTLASTFARLFRGSHGSPVSLPHPPLAEQVAITRRIEDVRTRLAGAPSTVQQRVESLLSRLSRFNDALAASELAIEDVEIALDVPSGTRLVLRESPLVLVAGPFALWGWINHVLPFNLARSIATRSYQSAADPAMRTIVIGLALVLAFYIVQGALVWWLLGGVAAALYWISLPITADVNFYLRARLTRVRRRARAYFLFRRDPELQARLRSELEWLKAEATAIAADKAFNNS